MGSNSEDDYEISDSEIDEREAEVYEHLNSGHIKVMAQRKQLLHNYNEEIRKIQQIARRHSQRIIDENQKLHSELETKMQDLDSKSKELDELAWQDSEIRKIQQIARSHSQRIIDENQKLHSELEAKMQELDSRSKDLDELASQSKYDRRNLMHEKAKNQMETKHLNMATMEQQRFEENVLKLVEEHKRQRKAALEKILKLQQQLDAKQKLELEIQQLQGKLEVMKHMPGEEDSEAKKKIKELSEELLVEYDEVKVMESLNLTLVIEERKSNDELQNARKELIAGYQELSVGNKRTGELDPKAFGSACKKMFSKEDAEVN